MCLQYCKWLGRRRGFGESLHLIATHDKRFVEQIVEFPEIAGYPMGGDFEIKYYMLQMHYNNPKLTTSMEHDLFQTTG